MTGEQSRPTPELYDAHQAYDTLRTALLSRGVYGPDAHYLRGDVELLTDTDQISGYYRASDYHAYTSMDFISGDPTWEGGPTPEEQRQLLEGNLHTILEIQLYDQEHKQQSTSYIICYPDYVRPDSNIGMLFYPYGHLKTKPPVIPTWPSGEPIITRRTGFLEDTVIGSLDEDPQLQLIFSAIQNGQQ